MRELVMVTEDQLGALVGAACEVRQRAYAPYSKYRVGAAVLLEGGRIVTGVNVENAVYGLTICAERAAIFAAVAQGARRILAIAVCTSNRGSPCGACRQVMIEFAQEDMPILMSDDKGQVRQTTLGALLPEYFGPGHLT
jgi:cytidine deaminase